MRDPSGLTSTSLLTSVDALWQGRVLLEQPLRTSGYRFNLDSVLLAGFVQGSPTARAVDLGAGCGIIGCLLLLSGKAAKLIAVERQPVLAALARSNAQRNQLTERLVVMQGDLREQSLPPCDLVVFNPPYAEFHAGRASACVGRDEARRECHGTVLDFVAAGARVLSPEGRLHVILPYPRRHALEAACVANGLQVARWQAVRAYEHSPPRHILVEARPAGDVERIVLAPLVVHRPEGGYSEAVEQLTLGPASLCREAAAASLDHPNS